MKRRLLSALVLLVPMALGAACRPTPEHMENGVSTSRHSQTSALIAPVAPLSAGITAAAAIAGFRHDRAASRLAFGTSTPSTVATPTVTKLVGPEGTLVEWSNGFTMGAAHSRAASKKRGPLTTDSAAHNARVLRYFAALPADQIARVDAHARMRRTGSVGTNVVDRTLHGFTSVITRMVDGVPVDGSYATAMFNVDDAVVAEQVWWPVLPSSLLDDIAVLKGILMGGGRFAAYRALLPKDVAGEKGEIRLHHAGPLGAAWYAVVTFDVAVTSNGAASTRSFDATGAEVDLRRMMLPVEAKGMTKPGNDDDPVTDPSLPGTGAGTGGGQRRGALAR